MGIFMLNTVNSERRRFLCAATGLVLSGWATSALATSANLSFAGTEDVGLISRDHHLDLRTAIEVAKPVVAEDGLGILYLDAFASASVEALEYLASIDMFVCHLDFKVMTQAMVGAVCSTDTAILSLGPRVDLKAWCESAKFDETRGMTVDLSRAKQLDRDSARRLVRCGASTIELSEFDQLSLEVAESLADFEGCLEFRAGSLTNEKVAGALARHQGSTLEVVSNSKPNAAVVQSFLDARRKSFSLDEVMIKGMDKSRWVLRLEPTARFVARRHRDFLKQSQTSPASA
jgi:hypothetical protein